MSAGVDPIRDAVGEHPLDNPVWSALTGPHAGLAIGRGLARRYPWDVAVFSALANHSAEAWRDLASLTEPGRAVYVFGAPPIRPPAGWTRVETSDGLQMVLDSGLEVLPALAPRVDGRRVSLRPLGADDVRAMVGLVRLTDPGPFRRRTIDLGGYVGIFHGEQLVAMAGERMRPPGYAEVSAVCTHPDVRRRGYASFLTAYVGRAILARGDVPFLHLVASNTAARAVYERLGFRVRQRVAVVGCAPPDGDDRDVTTR
jgi:ribosomal protein S18 acetylase RimI-like enzyme